MELVSLLKGQVFKTASANVFRLTNHAASEAQVCHGLLGDTDISRDPLVMLNLQVIMLGFVYPLTVRKGIYKAAILRSSRFTITPSTTPQRTKMTLPMAEQKFQELLRHNEYVSFSHAGFSLVLTQHRKYAERPVKFGKLKEAVATAPPDFGALYISQSRVPRLQGLLALTHPACSHLSPPACLFA